MKIAFIGTGRVGAALAVRLAKTGHDVVLAKRGDESESLRAALGRSEKLRALALDEAVRFAEVLMLATPFSANEGVLRPIAAAIAGKVLVDCTNPVGPGLKHGLDSVRAGSELVQSFVPDAKVVKAFSIYGYENLEGPRAASASTKPAMFFCGDDVSAKASVATLIEDCGFAPLDVGGLVQALHLEHMTLLWVRMVRGNRHSPHLAWAALGSDSP